jgi:hypothetical protein
VNASTRDDKLHCRPERAITPVGLSISARE